MTRLRTLFAFALTLGLVITAAPLTAQLCAGLPLTRGQAAVGLSAAFPESANTFGIDGRYKATDEVVVGASYALTSVDEDDFGGEDLPSQHTFGVQGAYEFTAPLDEAGPQLGICPNAGAIYTTWDELTMYSIPLGVGLGTAFEVSEGSAVIAPYVNPALVFAKSEVEELESDWENDFGFTAGANVIVTNLYFGALFSKVGDADGVFGVQAGIVF